jgi:hypothetical protein
MHIVPIAPDIDPTLALRETDIKRVFTAATLSAGRTYEQRGRVQSLDIQAGGAVITATTQGTRPDPYVQKLRVARSASGGIRISGACSCPVGLGCKHLAAVAVAAQRREQQSARAQASAAEPLPVKRGRGRPPSAATVAARAAAAPAPQPAPRPAPPPAALPAHIKDWLAAFDDEEQEPTEDYPASVRTRVFYVLAAEGGAASVPRLLIDPMTVTLKRDDSPGTIKRYVPRQVSVPAKYLRPSDRVILARLSQRSGYQGPSPEDDPGDTLRKILATGRARWGSAEGPAMTLGAERQGQIAWTTRADAAQHAILSLDEGLTGLRIPAPWYVDTSARTIGPVCLGMPPRMAARLLNAPAIPPEAAAEVRAQLSRRLPAVKAAVPPEPEAPDVVRAPMRPALRLMSGALPMDPSHGRGTAQQLRHGLYTVPLARLTFHYGPVALPRSVKPPPRLAVRNGRVYDIARDLAAEAAALGTLRGLSFGSVHEMVPVYYQHAHSDDFALREGGAGVNWLAVVTQAVPRLRAAGWTVTVDEDFPVQVVTADSEIEAELTEGQGIDWLELHLGVRVDGQQVDLVPALIRMIIRPEAHALIEGADDKPFVLPLLDGRLLSLPMARIRPTLQALLELWAGGGIDPETGKVGFSRLDAAELAALEERTGLAWRGGEALRALGRTLRQAGGIPKAKVPASFKATLRPYQAQGVDWLQFLGSAGLGGILADDMGLGKTVQTLAHLMTDKAAKRLDRPSLIVCPTSLIPNWLAEAKKFAPGLTVLPLHGTGRKSGFKHIASHDLVLTTYPLLTRDHEVLVGQDWHAVILDEAQSIKNPNAETTRQALRLKARQRLCLSGTPLQNHLGELWSLFDFLAPGFLGGQRAFKARYRTPIEKNGDADRQEALNKRIKPFMLRRTKQEVISELPPKTEIIEPVEMEANQRAIYEAIRLSMHAKVQAAIAQKGLARSGIVILDALLKMRQACCDPRLLKLKTVAKSKAGSAKLDRLMEMLGIMFSEGRRVLLFSQFTEMLALIQQRLAEDGVDYVTLTGDTKDRATPVKRFQAGEVPLFLISLKAGGVGLNLTAADTVIHYDPWWNPAAEDQATDRAHRIGQTKKVFVHRLVTLGTIEEKMEVLKDKKRAIVASVMDAEHGGVLKMTEADVEALFA